MMIKKINNLCLIKIFLVASFIFCGIFQLRAQNKPAIIKLNFHKQGDKKLITAQAFEYNNEAVGKPIPDLDLYFYVDRSFSPLPIGDVFSTTDENGEASVEFPNDLPGDTLGNVKIIVKIQDSDTYAKTEVSKVINWGVPLLMDHSENKRTLWAASANAPISLLLLVNGLIAVTWGIIIFVFLRIYKISRI